MFNKEKSMAKEEKLPREEEKKNEVSKKPVKMVTITFRENRKFELHIGREITVFLGRVSKQVPASYLQHKDWKNVSKYFIVKGV
jgi:hypothetical protein